ncbi:MAG TPA: YetF domain-containing protein [Rhodanobacteraceae bacterium]|nr:YetF domain-containing protein [Rhodanobacteraceae bacterium]
MHEMFALGVPAWELVCRAVIVYVALLILLRLSGKRTVGELSIFDLIVVIVLGSAVRTSLLGNDKSVLGGLLVVAVLLLLDFASAFLTARYKRVEQLLDGKPVLIARDGVVFHDVLKRCNVPSGTFDGVLRKHSLTAAQIDRAILEANGTITVCKRE